jgi:hypothetical protein
VLRRPSRDETPSVIIGEHAPSSGSWTAGHTGPPVLKVRATTGTYVVRHDASTDVWDLTLFQAQT